MSSTRKPHDESRTPTLAQQHLLGTAKATGVFEHFGDAVEKAGLGNLLRGPGPFTIFAPTDTAFERLPAGRLDSLYLPENQPELAAIVNYHIVAGRKSAADLGKWPSVRTVHGQAASVTRARDGMRVGGARVTNADIASRNGVIHAIDQVNIPTATTATGREEEA